MAIDNDFKRAYFTPQTGPDKGKEIEVHFNPVSLQYTVTNTLPRTGSGDSRKQHVSQASGQLTMELIFDTTDTGQDVRSYTNQVARFMYPVGSGDNENTPPVVEFSWGAYKFMGMVESYRETIDFFAASGVPLRASANLTMAGQDKVFESSDRPRADVEAGLSAEPMVFSLSIGGAAGVAALAGNARAGRALASFNGEASLRFGSGGGLAVGGSVQLQGPAAFVSAGAGIGVSASFGAGANIGVGGSASAGVSASQGAFAGLRTSSGSNTNLRLDTGRLRNSSETFALSTDNGASFRLGGRVVAPASSSLSADVGAGANLRGRIEFGD